MPALFLFDIDGTILRFRSKSSKSIFREIFQELFDIDVPEDSMPTFAGMTDLQILRDISGVCGLDFNLVNNRVEIIWQKLTDKISRWCSPAYMELFSGATGLIELLGKRKDAMLGLLTGNNRRTAYAKLSVYNLVSYFVVGAFGCDHEDRNKLPEIAIRRANEFSGGAYFSASNTVIIGDSPRDVECARSNDIASVMVATGGTSFAELEALCPDALFPDFSDFASVEVHISRLAGLKPGLPLT